MRRTEILKEIRDVFLVICGSWDRARCHGLGSEVVHQMVQGHRKIVWCPQNRDEYKEKKVSISLLLDSVKIIHSHYRYTLKSSLFFKWLNQLTCQSYNSITHVTFSKNYSSQPCDIRGNVYTNENPFYLWYFSSITPLKINLLFEVLLAL